MASGAERRAKRDLDAARVRGDLPPEQNPVTGEMINPHIPEFMAKAPWYAKAGEDKGAGLSHQRLDGSAVGDQSISALAPLYQRGALGARATGFRAGACRNCGAGTHKEKDCVERPRKVGAWKTGAGIARDEVIPAASGSGMRLGWDAKRDAYAGYNDESHTASVASRFEAVELEREAIRVAAAARDEEAKERIKEEKIARRVAARKEKSESGGGGGGEGGGAVAGAGVGAGASASACASAGVDDNDATDSGGDGFGPSS
jgi:pre-mRNA-processing factor SLU7